MDCKNLEVRFLGDFSVRCDDKLIVAEGSRVTKAIMLMQFLLLNRDRVVTQEELIHILLAEEESDNPSNALKNIVYRLRKMFEAEGFIADNIVIFKKNTYSLSSDCEYKLDIETFTAQAALGASEDLSAEERLSACMSALSLYRGEFLPKESGEMWAIPYAVSLQHQYAACLKCAYDICRQNGEYKAIYEVLNRAVSFYPYEEEMQAMRIGCLIGMKQYDKAGSEYEAVCSMLLDELGVLPGHELQEVYRQFSETDRPIEESINEVRTEISEEEYDSGAFFSNLQAFKTTYRFVVRNFERNGVSVFLILCTLRREDGTMLSRGSDLAKASQSFYEAARVSMRRGDLYTRYNPSQFLIMLTNITQENCKVVIGRIEKNFFKNIGRRNIALHCQIISAVDIDSIMRDDAFSGGRIGW